MLKNNEKILDVKLEKSQEKLIDLSRIYPLGKITFNGELKIEISYENKVFYPFKLIDNSFNNETARYLKIVSSIDQVIEIYMGLGYVAYENKEMSDKFLKTHGWAGADGIFSFNLTRKENYNQENDKTLFVFGDTFVGQADTKTKKRIEPTAFLNNTLSYFNGKEVCFVTPKSQEGEYVSIFEPNSRIRQKGYLAKNLTSYMGNQVSLEPYISEMDGNRDIELIFDCHGIHLIKKIEIENYHDNPLLGTSSTKRGVKVLDLLVSDDNITYSYVKTVELAEYFEEKPLNVIDVNIKTRYIKMVAKKKLNLNGSANADDKIIGLAKVRFFDDKGMLYDIESFANSHFEHKDKNVWFWLQDGIIKDDVFYIFPCIVEEELNGIEGFEFKISGVAMIEMKIENQQVNYNDVKMRTVPLYQLNDNKEYILPSAVYQEDEYTYFYGYYYDRPTFMRNLIVSRIKTELIPDLNHLEYFDGDKWQRNILEAKSLLQHVSCEMSVQKIVEGENKGKYLAIFQYDTNGPKIAYSIGESVTGPFTEPRIIYHTPEVDDYNPGFTYTYNAKSHLHLSSPKNILVSYNCNDTSMKHNKDDYTIYHPRFLNFIDTSND